MVGLGYKDFTDGVIATAAEADGYFMQQTVMRFASTAARDAALAPILIDGLFAFTIDTGTMWVYYGGAWKIVADPTAWASYTPVWSSTGTAVALGNGTIVGRQRRIGETMHVFIRLTWGSTTTGGTGAWQFTLPATPNFANQVLFGFARDTSAGFTYPLACKMNSASPEINEIGAHSAAGAIGQVAVAHPFTWANTDILTIEGSYMVTG